MKLSITLIWVFCANCALSHMPTVYEFCSYVVANGNSGQERPTCDRSQCQGMPGKSGREGPRGIPGLRGEKGDPGTSEHLEGKIRQLEVAVEGLTRALLSNTDMKEALCYMGMKNRQIPDSTIRTSSDWDGNHAGRFGRLDNRISGPTIGAWAARQNRIGEWIQVDLGEPKMVGGVVTQGRPQYSGQWVKSYKVSCGTSLHNMMAFRVDGIDKVFQANSNRDTKVINMFPKPQTCRYIRIYPQSWLNHISMRVDFIHGSCFEYY